MLNYLHAVRILWLRRKFGAVGKGFYVWGNFHSVHSSNIYLGKRVTINTFVYLNATETITIGDDVALSAHCMLITTGLDKIAIGHENHISKPISIGSRVQIGAGAIILPGVSIGSDVIIGAGSVVTRDVPDAVVFAGVPARQLEKL